MDRHPEVHGRQKNPESPAGNIDRTDSQNHTNDSRFSMNMQGILLFLVASNQYSRFIQYPLVSFY